MIINCPSCQVQFFVSASQIGEAGRTVRCSLCQHQWFQSPDAADDDFPLSVMPRPEGYEDQLDERSAWQRFNDRIKPYVDARPVFTSMLVTIVPLVFLGCVAAMALWFTQMQPPTLPEGVFVEGFQVSFAEGMQQDEHGAMTDLTVTGLIINETTNDLTVPVFKIADETGTHSAIVDSDMQKLDALSEIQFTGRVVGWESESQIVQLFLEQTAEIVSEMIVTDDNAEEAAATAVTMSPQPDMSEGTEALPLQSEQQHHQDEHHSQPATEQQEH